MTIQQAELLYQAAIALESAKCSMNALETQLKLARRHLDYVERRLAILQENLPSRDGTRRE